MSVVAERLKGHLHPRLAALQGDPSGEAAFWAEAARERTPLVEPDPAPGYSIVTYVFAAPEGAAHVVVNPGLGEARDNVMDRIAGTSVCHAAYRCRNDLRATYSFAPDLPLIPFEEASAADIAEMMAFMRDHPPIPDPHRRDHFLVRYGGYAPDLDMSVLALPKAPQQPWVAERAGFDHARGIQLHPFKSEILGNERRIWMYTPPGYDASGEAVYPVLVAFDGGSALSMMPTQRMLDALTADGRIRPHVGVFIDNATDTSRNDDLPCSEPFARFFEEELLPWLRGKYRVSHAREDYTVTGVSYGGLASMWFGYRLPHLFGTVISQAASLWWGPGWASFAPMSTQRFEPEWLIAQYEASPRLPVRYWMEIGLLEHPERMLATNRRMKALLEAKGYDLTYSEPCGGHDYAIWRGTLGEALAHMLPATAARPLESA
jgi:enterochelin esterase-like enzyme